MSSNVATEPRTMRPSPDEPFTLHISCYGPFGPATGRARSSAEISISRSRLSLAELFPEIAAQCMASDGGVPPPGYELAVFSGVNVYGADAEVYLGTQDEIHEAIYGEPASPPFRDDSLFCNFLQPKSSPRSILAMGARVSGGSDMGQLVFARRDCSDLTEPGAIIFPGAIDTATDSCPCGVLRSSALRAEGPALVQVTVHSATPTLASRPFGVLQSSAGLPTSA
jgi:hypothetical protein